MAGTLRTVEPGMRARHNQEDDDVQVMSVAQAVSMTAWRAVKPASLPAVLQWAALAGDPVQSTLVLAGRHGITPQAMRIRLLRVRRAAAASELPQHVRLEASRRSVAGEDHLARLRWAWLLHCEPPEPPPAPVPVRLSMGEWRWARQAAEVLDATGGLMVEELVDCMARLGRRTRRQVQADHLVGVLRASGMATSDGAGRWRAAAHITAQPLYRGLITAARASGRTQHTSSQIADLLLQAGYTNPGGSVTAYHPLLHHLGYDRWQVRSATAAPTEASNTAHH